jgi:hypothetical protein
MGMCQSLGGLVLPHFSLVVLFIVDLAGARLPSRLLRACDSVATIAMLVYFGVAIYLRSLPAFEVAAEFFVIAVIASCIGLLMGDVFFVQPIRARLRGQQAR